MLTDFENTPVMELLDCVGKILQLIWNKDIKYIQSLFGK